MSIILKALKKVEESKSEQETIQRAQTYQRTNKKLPKIILIGTAVLVLLIICSIGIYWLKGRTVSKPSVKPIGKVVDVQSKAVTGAKEKGIPPVEVPDITRLHEDAIRQIRSKNYSAAEETLKKGLAINPNDAVLHNNLGIALKNQGRYKEAAMSYEKAIQLKSDYYEAMNNLAVTQEMLGDTKKAKVFYKKALSIKPSYAEAHLNYALLLEAEGDNSAAEGHYHTFLNLSSDEILKSKVKERLKGLSKSR